MMGGLCGESNYSPSLLLHINECIKQAYYLCALLTQTGARNQIRPKQKSLLKEQTNQQALLAPFKQPARSLSISLDVAHSIYHALVQTNKFQTEHSSGTKLYLSVLCTLFQVGVHTPDLHVRSLHSHHEVSECSHAELSANVCIPFGHSEQKQVYTETFGLLIY